MVVGKVGFVRARVGIGSDGVGNKEAQICAYDENSGIGSQEEVDVLAIELKRGFGSYDNGENDGWL